MACAVTGAPACEFAADLRPKIAASFTMAELAVLTVVARQCQRTGVCTLHIDAIAGLAGCCRTVVKNALRQARLLGLLLASSVSRSAAGWRRSSCSSSAATRRR